MPEPPYARRQNPDGTVTVYKTRADYLQGRASSMGAAARRVPRILR